MDSAIYCAVDSVIHLLSNWGQEFNYWGWNPSLEGERRFCYDFYILNKTSCHGSMPQ